MRALSAIATFIATSVLFSTTALAGSRDFDRYDYMQSALIKPLKAAVEKRQKEITELIPTSNSVTAEQLYRESDELEEKLETEKERVLAIYRELENNPLSETEAKTEITALQRKTILALKRYLESQQEDESTAKELRETYTRVVVIAATARDSNGKPLLPYFPSSHGDPLIHVSFRTFMGFIGARIASEAMGAATWFTLDGHPDAQLLLMSGAWLAGLITTLVKGPDMYNWARDKQFAFHERGFASQLEEEHFWDALKKEITPKPFKDIYCSSLLTERTPSHGLKELPIETETQSTAVVLSQPESLKTQNRN